MKFIKTKVGKAVLGMLVALGILAGTMLDADAMTYYIHTGELGCQSVYVPWNGGDDMCLGFSANQDSTTELEIYMFFQYWENGTLKRHYLKPNSSGMASDDMIDIGSNNTVPVYVGYVEACTSYPYSCYLVGLVPVVSGRAYYVAFDWTVNGVHDTSIDVEY